MKEIISPELHDLANILSLRRPHEGPGEHKLIKDFIKPTGAKRDKFGNYILRIGTAPVLWSCHTDTVHKHKHEVMRQKLLLDNQNDILYVDNDDCLGADNGVGVWLLLEMIQAGIEGLYIFHRQEETGGHGSQYIATQTPELLEGIQIAIAFDRRSTQSIITFQGGTRCCSEAFASDLATALDLGHKADRWGTFTDTANYTELVPECTNVSAGFDSEHTSNESLDLIYVKSLRDRLLELDLKDIRIERDPGAAMEFDDDYYYSMYGGHGYAQYLDYEDIHREYFLANPELAYKVIQSWGMTSDLVADMGRVEIRQSKIPY